MPEYEPCLMIGSATCLSEPDAEPVNTNPIGFIVLKERE